MIHSVEFWVVWNFQIAFYGLIYSTNKVFQGVNNRCTVSVFALIFMSVCNSFVSLKDHFVYEKFALLVKNEFLNSSANA